MALRLVSKFPTEIVIDGEVIPFTVKRLTPQEAVVFSSTFDRMGRAATTIVVPTAEQEQETEMAARQFVIDAMTDYVTVAPGCLYDDDVEITAGADVVKMFGLRHEVFVEFLTIIAMENRLSAEQKVAWRTRMAPFVPTPEAVVEKMVEMAAITDKDVVYDPGCGDGRLVIAAAKRGATAKGWDIDADRVAEARAVAEAAGVADRCTFEQSDGAAVDFTQATVVLLYLLDKSNAKLRPILLKQLPAGARVVSHCFTMGGEWVFDAKVEVAVEKPAHRGQGHIYAYSVDRWRAYAKAPEVVSA